MNKGRTKMFAQKMKGVFKSRTRPQMNSKIPGNRECVSKLETGTETFHQNINNRNFDPYSKFSDRDHSSNLSISEKTKGDSNLEREANYPRFADAQNERECNVVGKNSFEKFTNFSLGVDGNGVFGGLSRDDELQKEKKNIINGSCHFSHLDLDINRSSDVKIYDPEILSEKAMLEEINLNIESDSLWPRRRSYSCDLGMCHYCLKQKCICRNNNLISTNNNYLFKSFHTKPSDSSWFSSVLKYAFTEEKTNRNDFIILTLGIHHYIKEVFNALESNNNGYVHYEDSQILCNILGKDIQKLRKSNICSSFQKERVDEANFCEDNSCEIHLHFGKFSEIICSTFSDMSESNCLEKRKNTQLVNAVVNITRRNESLNVISKQLEELENEYLKFKRESQYSIFQNFAKSLNDCDSCTKERPKDAKNHESHSNSIYLENLKLQKIILLQQQELQCLREVIEDLRVSLQCSDAENLSLRVRDAKLKRCSFISSSSEEEFSKHFSSTDDERDSIDRIIMNFPSSEQLKINSNESLLSMESLNLLMPDRTPSVLQSIQEQLDEKVVSPKPRTFHKDDDHHDDDLSLEKELQIAYQKLSETRSELEATRSDLENSVAEIQDKNIDLDRLNEKLIETKENFEKSMIENTDLKEKIVFLKGEEENRNLETELLQKELTLLKSELLVKNKEIIRLTDHLKDLENKRRRDIHQLCAARNIIASSLSEMKKNEDTLKTLLKTSGQTIPKSEPITDPKVLKEQSLIISNNPGNFIQLDNNNNNNRTLRQFVTANNCTNSSHVDFGNKRSSDFSNKGNFNVIKGSNNFNNCKSNYNNSLLNYFEGKNPNEEHNRSNASLCEIRRSNFDCRETTSKRTKAGEHSSPVSNCQSLPEKVLLNKTNGTLNDVTKYVRVTSQRERNAVLTSPHYEDKPTLEVKPNLTKPIAIMKPLLKYPQLSESFKRFKVRQLPLNEPGRISINDRERPPGKDPFVITKLTTQKDPVILCQEKDLKRNFGKEFESSSKCHLQTSTQILEGIEAEVELLRKSLEDDQLLG